MKNKRDVPKLNKENFPTCKILMKLHISSISNAGMNFLRNEYVEVTNTPLIAKEQRHKLDHNQAMLQIASEISCAEFDDLKDYNTTKKMWDKLKTIYRGYDNLLKSKVEILRGKFYGMRLMEGENIVQYYTRVKEFVNAIRQGNGTIEDETMIKKVLRTLLHIHAIRVSVI